MKCELATDIAVGRGLVRRAWREDGANRVRQERSTSLVFRETRRLRAIVREWARQGWFQARRSHCPLFREPARVDYGCIGNYPRRRGGRTPGCPAWGQNFRSHFARWRRARRHHHEETSRADRETRQQREETKAHLVRCRLR